MDEAIGKHPEEVEDERGDDLNDAQLVITEVKVTDTETAEEEVEQARGHAGLALSLGVKAGLAIDGLTRLLTVGLLTRLLTVGLLARLLAVGLLARLLTVRLLRGRHVVSCC